MTPKRAEIGRLITRSETRPRARREVSSSIRNPRLNFLIQKNGGVNCEVVRHHEYYRDAHIVVYNDNLLGVSRMTLTCALFDREGGPNLDTRDIPLTGYVYLGEHRTENKVLIAAVDENVTNATCRITDAWWW
jgi:hypothetical protein